MTFPKKLTLVAWNTTIEGCGEELEIVLDAFKGLKNGAAASWRGQLVLKINRHEIRKMSLAIAQMHKRDLERLAQERDRLEFERAPLNGLSTTKE